MVAHENYDISTFPLSRECSSFELMGCKLVRPTGFEPVTFCLEGRCSIHLSYGLAIKIGRNGQIRTDGILLPKQALYQAELHSVKLVFPRVIETRSFG